MGHFQYESAVILRNRRAHHTTRQMLSGTSGLGEGGRERETDSETERQSHTQGQADSEKERQTSGLEHEDGRSLGSKSGMVVKIELKSRSVYIVFIGSLVSMPEGSASRIQDSGFGLLVQVLSGRWCGFLPTGAGGVRVLDSGSGVGFRVFGSEASPSSGRWRRSLAEGVASCQSLG